MSPEKAYRWRRIWLPICWTLDWLDDTGQRPDHGKLLGDVVVWAVIIAQFSGHAFSLGVAGTLVIAGQGARTIMAAIKGGVWGFRGTESVANSVTKVITERRDAAAAVEPTP